MVEEEKANQIVYSKWDEWKNRVVAALEEHFSVQVTISKWKWNFCAGPPFYVSARDLMTHSLQGERVG